MSLTENALSVVDGEALLDLNIDPPMFCVQGLLPQGLSILGGAPKVGKSWLVLALCLAVAKGEPIWNLPTTRGTALYLCLEDTLGRIQQRLGSITDEAPPNLFFANAASTLAEDLEEQILDFCREHPDTKLIAIDTFQLVRVPAGEPSYGGDYQEMGKLKRLADALQISVLLVHHLRKQGDRDPVNRLSGTSGIGGAVDSIFILDREERSQSTARLICTGRDLEHRELGLRFSGDSCLWELVSDGMDAPEHLLPREMELLLRYMAERKCFRGSSTELAQELNRYGNLNLSAKGMKQMMNRWRYGLQELGLTFQNRRSNGQRFVEISFCPPEAVTQGTKERGA